MGEINEFRAKALALPSAMELPHHGTPSFRINGKIFAQISPDGLTALLKLPLSLQEWGQETFLDACQPEPGQWGKSGWTRLRWTELPEGVVIDLIEASWAMVAPAGFKSQKHD